MKTITFKSIFAALLIVLFSCNNNSSVAQTPPDGQHITQQKKKKIKIALLLDTSNSMDGLIEQAKSQLWQLVNELMVAKCDGVAPELEIALYEYGNDRLSAREGYIRQVTALTSDLDKISADLFSLTTNGGSEFCGQVIQTALNQQDWSATSGDLQIIFIAGNEPFNQGGVNYEFACNAAKQKNVIVNTIHCGPYQTGVQEFWKHGADLAGGQYMCIEQDRKTVYIPSPYDDKITQLNVQLNQTYIGYGSQGRKKKEAQKVQDDNAQIYGNENSVKRAVSKSSHFYKNSNWDLVDAMADSTVVVEELADEQLPEELQGKTADEKKAIVAEKAAERERIQNEIQSLNKKREAHVAEVRKEQGEEEGMLDKVMLKAIKDQAGSVGLVFE